ncbi:conserved hypothetical protein [Paraburkholderia unamae]|nr:conserved hypothetical protein [Paraburkholderia unamae]
MPGIHYAVVEGDPLDNGESSRVIAKRHGDCAVEGPDGAYREMAFVGDSAFCCVCNSTGTITQTEPVHHGGRMIGSSGMPQAVGGDSVLCACPRPPRIVAKYGRNWEITDDDYRASGIAWAASRVAALASGSTYNEQFMLRDGSGSILADTYYTVRLPSGELIHGTTDDEGRTARYPTDGVKRLYVYLGHRTEVRT